MLGITFQKIIRFLCHPWRNRAYSPIKDHTPNPIYEPRPISNRSSFTMLPMEDIPVPDRRLLNEHFLLGEILDHIELFRSHFPNIDITALIKQINEIRNHNVDPEQHLRAFLQIFWETGVFKKAFEELDENTKRQVHGFVSGSAHHEWLNIIHPKAEDGAFKSSEFQIQPSPAVKHHFTELAETIHEFFHPHEKEKAQEDAFKATDVVKPEPTSALPEIWEDHAQTQRMEVHHLAPFNNWGLSVLNTPSYTFIPRTVLGLSNLVKFAKAQNLRVRVGGYRHSWSSTFSQEGQIFISLLNLEEVTRIPDPMSISLEYIDPTNELKVIQVLEKNTWGDMGIGLEEGKGLVRVGVSVTNEQFRRWAVKNDRWTLPMDVILVEVTIGGVNGPICHGAGRAHPTMSDIVRGIEYIDANGVPQKITNPAHLRAAAGSFGLLGVVTHLTLAVDPMSYAILAPTKPPVGLAIPPLSQSVVPLALQKTWRPSQLEDAQRVFEERATNAYYSEYFWFTYQKTAWVNTWDTVKDGEGAVEYPSPFGTWLQWVEGWLGGVITSTDFFKALPGRWQAQLLATSGMVALPPFTFDTNGSQTFTEVTKTPLPNALHFRRGIQNMRVRDMEFQIPIPWKKTTDGEKKKPDFSIVQRAWWDVVNLVYSGTDASSPMRLTLELRIMAGSNIIMAPQRGNEWGTCSIEVLSIPDAVDDGEWTGFCQQVADLWMGYEDEEGNLLNVRSHWAKEWEHIQMRGRPAREYVREVAFKDAIVEFKDVMGEIGKEQGWSLEDLKERFSNQLWDEVVFHEEGQANGVLTNGSASKKIKV